MGQIEGYGYSPNVQFTAKVKFSKPYQEDDPAQYGGTRRYTLTEQGLKNERVGGQGFRLDDPKNIAEFIAEAKQQMPAKKYILILWNHGSEFTIEDQPVAASYPEVVADSRALGYDDNTNERISIFELEEALKQSGEKLDMIYWDVCLMNTMENICQIKDYTKYILGASHLTSGFGGNYTNLMYTLDNNSDLLEAMSKYVPATINHWSGIEGLYYAVDLGLYDMSYVDDVTKVMKEYIDALIQYRDKLKPGSQQELRFHYFNGTAQKDFPYYATGGVLYYYHRATKSVDMYSGFNRIGNLVFSGKLSALIVKLKYSIDKMIPISHCAGTPDYINSVSVGINWIDKTAFQEQDTKYPVSSLEGLYPKLKFDQSTGWSRFLKSNVRKKVGFRTVIDPETQIKSSEFYEIEEGGEE